ncbi:MAG: glycosyltransferase family 2 protein [Bacteroidetes bacterium]|nr:glycosyltransferase family 2 protein [Bacteroidota bacterium]
MAVSVVIITKNEAHIIGTTLQSLQGITDDCIIVDSGSTDDTVTICKKMGCKVIETTWDGYGPNKNKGIDAAQYDWILNLDADEALDETLKAAIQQLNLADSNTVYNFKFKNFFCNKWIRFGEWSGDWHIRLFNRKAIRWNDAAVHEGLTLQPQTKVVQMPGHVLHYTTNSMDEYISKTMAYAKLNAEKYHQQGKKAGFIKTRIAPGLNFFQHYILRLGFLDGWEGYLIAKTSAWYTFLKYSFLRAMNKQ